MFCLVLRDCRSPDDLIQADGREVILTEGSGSVIEKSPVIAVVGTEQESVHVPNSVAPSGKD